MTPVGVVGSERAADSALMCAAPAFYRSAFYSAVIVRDGMTDFDQGRAAALMASSFPGDDWSTKASVQTVNEQPRQPVRHPHLTTGLQNRAVPGWHRGGYQHRYWHEGRWLYYR